MIPAFTADGYLPPGVHWTAWQEICDRFGGTVPRRRLLKDLRAALANLQKAGCASVYLDGSFVTLEPSPGDCDGCWDTRNVDPALMDPALTDIDDDCRLQRMKYGTHFFPANLAEGRTGRAFLDFFQTRRDTGGRKGIIAIDLRSAEL